MAKPLTAVACQKLKPTKKRREVPDGGCAGLYLIIGSTGGKSFAMRFRRPDGRPCKLTLGPFDPTIEARVTDAAVLGAPLTLAMARELAGQVHRQRQRGIDVVAQRREIKTQAAAAGTFGEAVHQFVEEHARPRNRRWRTTARALGLDYPADGGEPTLVAGGLAERWHEKPIGGINGHDIHTLIEEARRQGIPGMGRRNSGLSDPRGRMMGRTLGKLFSWLQQHRRITTNPCVGVWIPQPPASRERVLTADEIRSFWRACGEISEPFGPLLKLLLLTGCRRDEVAEMTRNEIGDDGTVWTIPAARTKNKRMHTVPLSPMAREILDGVKQIAGKPGFVFTTNGRTPVSGWSKVKRRLDAAMAIPPWRIHDLRRTVVTGMVEIGILPHVVEAVVNHVSGHRAGVAGVYNRSELMPERKAALERWAAHVKGLVSGNAAQVISMPRRIAE